MLTFSLCLSALVAAFLYAVRKMLSPHVPVKGKTNIPGPTEGISWPIVGDALWFSNIENLTDMWNIFTRLLAMRDKVISYYLGRKLIIAVKDAKLMEAIINTNKCNDKDRELYHPFNVLSNGIFSRNGRRWAAMRKPLDKQMHPKFMRNYNNVFAAKAETLCHKVGGMQGTFNINNLMQYCTMDITLEALLGIPGAQQENSSLNRKMEKLVASALARIVKPQYNFDWFYNLSEEGRIYRKQKNDVRPIFQEMTARRYKYFEENGLNPDDPDFEPQNYIDIAIQVGRQEKLAEDDLNFSFFDFIVAGFDTSSIAMSSAILFLAMHPAYQEQVYREQVDIMGDGLEAPSQEEVSRMNFLSMVINETLRLVQPPAIGKTLSARIEVDGYVMPEGASIIFSLHHMHRDPKHWSKPNEFYPEHFLPENVAKRTKGTFKPFSSGSRSCAGKLFALLSMKVIVSMLIRRYRFTTDLKYEEMTYKFMLMLESDCGYPVEAIQRNNARNCDQI